MTRTGGKGQQRQQRLASQTPKTTRRSQIQRIPRHPLARKYTNTIALAPKAGWDRRSRAWRRPNAPMPNPTNLQVGDTWDLRANWSETNNPTGPWLLGSGGGGVMLDNMTHTEDLGADAFNNPDQPGWESPGTVPLFARSLSMRPLGYDILTYDVFSHGTSMVHWTNPDTNPLRALNVRCYIEAWPLRGGTQVPVWILEDGTYNNDDNDHLIGNSGACGQSRDTHLTGWVDTTVNPGQTVGFWFAVGNYVALQPSIEILGFEALEPICVDPPVGDIAGNDCWVDLLDLAALAATWLDCGLDIPAACFN